jgi:hypothetical protein
MSPTAAEPVADVRDWVRRYRVCWEILPLHEMTAGRKLQVGFELNVFARQDGPARPDQPSPDVEDLFSQLRQFAERTLPKGPRTARFDIQPFDSAEHLRAEAGFVPEVQVTVRIVHASGYFAPPDADERAAVKEIETRLASLGARRRAWPERRR